MEVRAFYFAIEGTEPDLQDLIQEHLNGHGVPLKTPKKPGSFRGEPGPLLAFYFDSTADPINERHVPPDFQAQGRKAITVLLRRMYPLVRETPPLMPQREPLAGERRPPRARKR